MIETTNYGLKTYEADDIVNVMTVDKENMEIIDTAMKVNQESSVGIATELVSGSIHALTRINPDIPVFRFTATSNFTAGETFVVDGIQVTALLPSGETLGSGAYIVGSEVMCALRDTLLTVYCPQGTVATASDSERLGGELPEYYATKEEVDTAQSTATASGVLAQSCQSQISTMSVELSNISQKVGEGMKCALFGNYTLSTNESKTIDISSLGLESSQDYMVILSGDGPVYSSGAGLNPYVALSQKTATSFTLVSNSRNNAFVSYQVITFR